MKTVFIAFTLKNSSVAHFNIALANYLARKNKVIIFSHANEKHNFTISDSITVLRWPSKRPTGLKDLKFLIKYIKIYNPCTVIGNFAAVNIFMLGGFFLGVENRIAWHHTLTTQLEQHNFLKLRKKLFFFMSTKIIANSEAGKADVVESFGINQKKVEVIPNAVRDPFIKSATIKNKIVFAGRLHQVKGVEVLVKALAIVKEVFENIELVVIGEDEGTGELGKLKALQRQLDLDNNIKFVGNRSRSYVLEQFSTAYCAIVPSFFEAFGYVVIESFSVHTPVIGSASTGVSEIIRNNRDGFLFEPGNHVELAEKIIELMKNNGLRERMAESCYKRFLEKYELNKVVKNFTENSSVFK